MFVKVLLVQLSLLNLNILILSRLSLQYYAPLGLL